jgi:hypothetical protein
MAEITLESLVQDILPSRVANSLNRAGVRTLSDLAVLIARFGLYREQELTLCAPGPSFRMFGVKASDLTFDALHRAGFNWKPYVRDWPGQARAVVPGDIDQRIRRLIELLERYLETQNADGR